MELNLALEKTTLAAGAAAKSAGQATPAIVDEDRGLSFGEITEKYYRRIYNLICYQVGDLDEAADLTQETFVKAFRAYHAFKGESRVSTWLWRIALNMCKSSYRKRARRERLIPLSIDADVVTDEGEMSREVPDWSVCPENVVETRELRAEVRRAIQSLAEPYRVAIILCDIEGCSYQEIADITQISVQAVKSRIHRGRRMLRKKLERYVQG
ncbi:MAG TPA: sigma-70 family RNA polymerase sigma factor [Armatimonadota bacterium]|jgi:RNA polymerase sigma-70 factor (ECF subfamily)|nr:sigma-70 family RNA polymerase sigma factor [Armatimonadota bacterium]HOM82107.1 sigma-70 family RNA polymerase sigma factor [Armatimonadota bacterium]HPO73615.1 sigma-70 family RNA polymerase sigma factor [Armatimonadota bacterium]HPT99960.1 sigma-70 family RNA polymerase sigma factor [Armatimonadota bacterium]